MAAEIPEVSRSGVACGEYADCLELLTENRNFDYDGNGGVVQIGARVILRWPASRCSRSTRPASTTPAACRQPVTP